jgi:hypothetical protein
MRGNSGGFLMEIAPVSLVLADISGYTRFVMMHKISLMHAEEIITELMEAVISEASEPLFLNKLEGDAAFLYALGGEPGTARITLQRVLRFFTSFMSRQQELIKAGEGGCFCEACCNISSLKLKAIIHHGQAVIKQVHQLTELAGSDVILAHRLLKNTIGADEYLLVTEDFYRLSGGLPDREPRMHTESYDEIGQVKARVYFSLTSPLKNPTTPRFSRPAGILAGLKLFPLTFWRRLVQPRTFRNLSY